MQAQTVRYEVVYEGRNITGEINRFLRHIVYTDKSDGEADELEITLEDSADLWKSDWYPQKGDTVSLSIFYKNNTLDCGSFTVDEISASGSVNNGDIFVIKGLAASINKKVRTKNSFAHENKTLREIANTIAQKHGLKLQGTISNVQIKRETQYNKTDLKFLKELAAEYGYTFNVRGNTLVFTSIYELENRPAAFTIKRNEVSFWQMDDKTSGTYKNVELNYHNSQQKKNISYSKSEDKFSTKEDTLTLNVRAENSQQAELKAKAALYRANSLQQEGTAELEGNTYAVAGNCCTLEGFKMFDGLYYIHESTHIVEPRGGYTTSVNIKRTSK